MKTTLLLIPLACLLSCGCDQKSKPKEVGDNPVTAPADYLGAINKAKKAADRTLSAVNLDQAIKSFFVQENRYPKNLDELVSSGTLPKLPDPPAGMKFDYDPNSGTVKVVRQN